MWPAPEFGKVSGSSSPPIVSVPKRAAVYARMPKRISPRSSSTTASAAEANAKAARSARPSILGNRPTARPRERLLIAVAIDRLRFGWDGPYRRRQLFLTTRLSGRVYKKGICAVSRKAPRHARIAKSGVVA
jgi:hypothetical protein